MGTGLLGLVHPEPSLPCGHVPVGARVNICWMKEPANDWVSNWFVESLTEDQRKLLAQQGHSEYVNRSFLETVDVLTTGHTGCSQAQKSQIPGMGWPVGCRSTAALCAGFPTAGLPGAPGKAHRHSRAITTCDPERPAGRSQTHTSNSKKMGLPDRQQMISQCKDVPSIAWDIITLRKIRELKSSLTGRSVSYPAPQGWDGPGGGGTRRK